LIRPSKKSIATFLSKVKKIIHENRTAKTLHLIRKLNPLIRGWTMYHRHVASKRTFYYIDYRIYWMIWNWAKRRHPNKNTKWILRKYYTPYKGITYTLHAYDDDVLITLMNAGKVNIKRHVKIKGNVNPYDIEDELYFEKRSDYIMLNKLSGRKLLTFLYKRQRGKCPHCNHKITKQSGWNAHHLLAKHLGGKYTEDNLVLLHPVCHRQVHAQNIQFDIAALC